MSSRVTLVSVLLSCLTVFRQFDALTIENKDGINQYWYAMYISGVNGDAEITEVSIRDSSSTSSMARGTLTYYNFWAFQSDDPNGWTLPLSVRIQNSNGEEINSFTLITNFNWYAQFDFGSNFALDSPAPPENTNIEIINKNGINQWWHAFFVKNLNENGGEITNVEIRDASEGASWESGYSGTDHELGTFYAFQNNNGWELPLDIRLTNCGGEILTNRNVIRNRIEYGIYDFGNNFADTTCVKYKIYVFLCFVAIFFFVCLYKYLHPIFIAMSFLISFRFFLFCFSCFSFSN